MTLALDLTAGNCAPENVWQAVVTDSNAWARIADLGQVPAEVLAAGAVAAAAQKLGD
ncbi:MAG: hypothetical protein WAM94_08120 [Chromatiaceae bacterium]